jgi:hypothetical protein
MKEKSTFVQNYPAVEAVLNDLMKDGPQWGEFSFDTGVLGDMLHGALTENWHLLPEMPRHLMAIVLAELYMHSNAERISDEKAAELVERLRKR